MFVFKKEASKVKNSRHQKKSGNSSNTVITAQG